MSTSICYHLFGTKGYNFEALILDKGKIIFKIVRKKDELKCSKCNSKDVIKKGSKIRSLRAWPSGHYRKVFLDVTVHKLHCKSCNSRTQESIPIIPFPKAHHTKVFEYLLYDLLEFSTIQDIAKFCDIDWNTIKEIDKRRLKKRLQKYRYKDIRYIALDEIYLGKKIKYKTIVLNLETQKVVYVGDGRGKDAILNFFIKIQRYGKNLNVVAMDMSGAYYSAVKEIFPEVPIIFDHFHIVKLMNEKIDDLRREYQNKLNSSEKKVIKGKRFLLLMNPVNMTEDQKDNLKELLELNTPLTSAYILKEELRMLWYYKDKEEGNKFIDNWLYKAEKSNIKQMKQLSKTLIKYKKEILNYFLYTISDGELAGHRLSTGPLEGLNNKIKTMIRKSYGLKDEEYLKLKLMNL